jgi:cobalt-precorrin 5A hydrolase/precorrin-3B C17-methyltransferase
MTDAVGAPGPGRGRVAVVGLGPGDPSLCTPEVQDLLATATDRVGYTTYLDLAEGVVPSRADQAVHRTDNREEAARAAAALDLAAEGRHVVVVSSGDPGIFAMAAAVVEQLDLDGRSGRWADVEVSVHPGVSAAQVAAARAGAPLGHDFCVISLSDNLKPWAVVERRLALAAEADLVLALYNPRSAHRPEQLGRAVAAVATHRAPATPVVLARDVGRPAEEVRVVTMGEMATAEVQATVDMRTVVLVGSSQTRVVEDARGRRWTYTPRSHPG